VSVQPLFRPLVTRGISLRFPKDHGPW
jgi:hypothetical protein